MKNCKVSEHVKCEEGNNPSIMNACSSMKSKSVLCIVETPFQVLMAYMMFSDRGITGVASVTLALSSQIRDATELADTLDNLGVFESVVVITPRYQLPVRGYGLYNVVDNFFRPRHCRNQFFEFFPVFKDQQYDLIACSGTTRLTLDAIIQCTQTSQCVFFDDGVGSHNGAVFEAFSFFEEIISVDRRSNSFKHRVKLFGKRIMKRVFPRASFDIQELWLFNASSNDKDRYVGVPVHDIPLGEPRRISSIFGFKGRSIPSGVRIIYLSLPSSAHPLLKSTELEIIRLLNDYLGDEFAVKIHPRGLDDDFSSLGVQTILPNVVWEGLVLDGTITDSTVLLGCSSTALLTPKTFAGLEPELVFLYQLFSQDVIVSKNCQDIVNDALSRYSRPDKIKDISSMPEFEKLIKEHLTSGAFAT